MDDSTNNGDSGGTMPTSSTATRRRRKRNLKNMALEVGVIVTGVGIALLGEYLITERSWSTRVERAKIELRDEAGDLAGNAIERIVITPCILAQLDDVEAHLLDPAKNAVPMASVDRGFGSYVVLVPTRSYPDDAWQSSINDGVTARLPRYERLVRSQLYATIEHLRDEQRITTQVLDRLNLLAVEVERTPEANLRLLQDVQELRRIISFNAEASRQHLAGIDALGDLPSDEDLAASVDVLLASKGGNIEYCTDRGFPLETSDRTRDDLMGQWTGSRDGIKAALEQD